MQIPAAILLAGTALGVGLVQLGWSRRPRLGQPRCAGCGAALWEQSSPLTAPCTRGGCDPNVPCVVRFDLRRRRWWLVAIGVVVLGAAVWHGARRAIEAIADRPWPHVRPVTWVLRDVRSSDAVTRDAAWSELCRRLFADELDPEALDAAVDRLVEVAAIEGAEGEIWRIWFFRAARHRKALSHDQTGRLTAALVERRPVIQMRRRVPQGSRPRFEFACDVSNVFPRPQVVWVVHGVRDEWGADVPLFPVQHHPTLADLWRLGEMSPLGENTLAAVALDLGRHRLEFDVEIGVFDRPCRTGTDPRFWPTAQYRQRLRLFHEIEVTRRGTTSIDLVTDPALEPVIRWCVTIRGVGGAAMPRESVSATWKQLDVILRPNVKIAEHDIEADRMWGRELVFEDVPTLGEGVE